MGCHILLQGILLTQGSNPGFLHLLHWQAGSLPLAPLGKPMINFELIFINYYYYFCLRMFSFFSTIFWKKKSECESCSVMSDSLRPHGPQSTKLLCPWNSPGQNTGMGSCSLLHRIFPTQGSNPCLLHCRRILYCLSHQRSPYLLERLSFFH